MTHEQPGDSERTGAISGQESGGGGDAQHSSEEAADSGADSLDAVGSANPASVGENGRLDTVGDGQPDKLDDDDDDDDVVEAEVVAKVAKRVTREVKQTLTSYRGPLPPAAEYRAYNDVLPGAADRILSMAEKALDAQVEVDTTLAHGDTRSVRRGQWQSTAVVVLSLAGALTAVLVKAPWEAVAVFGAPSIFEFASSLVRAIREPRKSDDD